MLRISNDNERHVIVYSEDTEADELVIKVLQSYFKHLLMVRSKVELLATLVNQTPKVIFLSTETIPRSLEIYYQILSENPTEQLCEHKIVCLCSRRDEKCAYTACISEVIDDYIISKPLYEMYRPILITRHLLAEMGIQYIEQSVYKTNISQLAFSEELASLVNQGIRRKTDLKEHIQQSIERIEKVIDKAKLELFSSNKTSLDVSELKQLLSTIRSNEIRPELLRLQEKALTLLDGLIKPAEQLVKASVAREKTVEKRQDAQQLAKQIILGAKDLHPAEAFLATSQEGAPLAESKAKKEPPFNRLFGIDNIDTLVEEAKRVSAAKREKLTILLIEEDHISLNLTIRVFDSARYEVLTASTGHSAVNYIQNREIDLVFMDLTVPDCDCLNLAEQINRREGHKPKFIVLTSKRSKDFIRLAAVSGVKMYLLKPFTKMALEKVLEKSGWGPAS